MSISAFALSPLTATIIFVAAILAGYSYRRVWKASGPRWQLWFFGLVAAGGLMIVGLIPVIPD